MLTHAGRIDGYALIHTRRSQRSRFHANGHGKRERPFAVRQRVTTVGDVYNPFQTLVLLNI